MVKLEVKTSIGDSVTGRHVTRGYLDIGGPKVWQLSNELKAGLQVVMTFIIS
jgi:hypothetical protein